MIVYSSPLNAPWGYLLYGLAAVALAALLFVGRGSMRRSVVILTAAASLSLITDIAVIVAVLYHSGSTTDTSYVIGFNSARALGAITTALTYAAWGLLLFAALQARRYGWFVAAALVIAVAIAAPPALIATGDSAAALYKAIGAVPAAVALNLFDQIATLLALVFAIILPVAPAASIAAGEEQGLTAD